MIYGRLKRCAHRVVSHVRAVEQSISTDTIRAHLVSITEWGYRDVVLVSKSTDADGRDRYVSVRNGM
jgi:tRNA A37 methylthiotransferase MiaB